MNSNSEEEKAKLVSEVRNNRVEYLLKILGLAYVISFSLGAILIFVYFLRQNFNAGSISASDTVSMALTWFGFFAMSAFGFFLASYVMYPVQWVVSNIIIMTRGNVPREPPVIVLDATSGAIDTVEMSNQLGASVRGHWKGTKWFDLSVGSILLSMTALAIYAAPVGFFQLVVTFLGGGLWLSHIFNWRSEQVYCRVRHIDDTSFIDRWADSLRPSSRLGAITIFVLTGMLTINFGVIQDASLNLIGFRKQDVSVRMVQEDFKFLLQESARVGMVVNPCEPLHKDEYVLHNADVLWYKLGAQGLLRYPAERIGEDNILARTSVRMEPLSSNLNILKATKRDRGCSEYATGALFAGEQSTLSASAISVLRRELEWLKNVPANQKIQITWHDSAPLMLNEKTSGLKVRRLASLKDFLLSSYKLSMQSLLIVDAGIADQKLTCDQNPIVARTTCDLLNRRVQIQQTESDE